jgi:hypothetical protein
MMMRDEGTNVKDWKRALGAFFRPEAPRQSSNATPLAEAQNAWEDFVTRAVIPTFQELKSIPLPGYVDGISMVIEQATTGEHWVRLTESVVPSPRMIASLPPSVRNSMPPASPSIILTYTVTADVSSGDTRAWSETHAPDAPESKRFVREELGDYRSLTRDAIKANYFRRKFARYR